MPALAGMIYNIQLIRFTIYTIPFSISEIMLPEYSASSSASIMPPLIFMPFHLVQNTLDHLIGLSSASSAPALVRYPCSSASPKEIRSFSLKLFPVHFLYLSCPECYLLFGQTDSTAISIGFLWYYLSVQSYHNRFILIGTIEPIISFF